jgi:Mg-chelatase subunit ChlD
MKNSQIKISFHKKVFIPIQQWKSVSHKEITDKLRTLKPRGGTNLTCGFQKALSEFDRVEKGEIENCGGK